MSAGAPAAASPENVTPPTGANVTVAADAAAWIGEPGDRPDVRVLGGKAATLAAMADAGLPVPPWRVVTPEAHAGSRTAGTRSADGRVRASDAVAVAIRTAVAALVDEAARDGGHAPVTLAVRSSAADEDGVAHSFAGQFESHLHVALADVVARVEDVWSSASEARVAAYRHERGLASDAPAPAVLLQPMVDADVAGVAFSADPVSGRRGHAIVAATWGLGSALVDGDVDGDSWTVDRAGAIVARNITHKAVARRRAAAGSGVIAAPVDPALCDRPALDDEQVRQVAALARAAERHAGRPQDIEWALAGGRLVLLQSRPITALAALPDPDGAPAIWDNSNIVESYGGVTTPLTYTFARTVYEAVYAQFCRLLAVREATIDANAATFRCMIGLVRGRVFYNLVNWYRVLALLPGYALNRGFMEQMMGVKEPLPPELADALAMGAAAPGGPVRGGARLRAVADVVRCAAALVRAWRTLPRDIVAFRARLDGALDALPMPLEVMRADELVAHYRDLEQRLLRRWDAPLVNDFFAMIAFGLLGRLCARWAGDGDGTLHNDLVSGAGDIVSAEPARRIEAIAALVRAVPDLAATLAAGSSHAVRCALHRAPPEVARAFDAYLRDFGDRCLEELKLETRTLVDDPEPLHRAVGRVAGAPARVPDAGAPHESPRARAEARVRAALGRVGLRPWLFGRVLRAARDRVRDRENLRFERTRLFGRVRRIFVELGRRYASAGLLADSRDVFYLDVDEVLGAVDATVSCDDLAALASVRRAAFARHARAPAPADRFLTRGLVLAGHDFAAPTAVVSEVGSHASDRGEDADERRGIGCHPGVVTGRVRVVRDPRSAALEPGEILVAERTDPGWIMLFPAASALLVERGSLLSHSAIVARELGLPAVVSIAGLTRWLETGDVVTLDGRRGVVARHAGAGPDPAAGA